ncbi:hypothetical protein TWF696_008582 [Orbilia brochopaga]|uniref:Uncharacterized protein n=1 Tax=Orbilia brochopaga TaxID=3140254 RepID=A0AAV9UGE5_9PEZI
MPTPDEDANGEMAKGHDEEIGPPMKLPYQQPESLPGHWEYWNDYNTRDKIPSNLFDEARQAIKGIEATRYPDPNMLCSMGFDPLHQDISETPAQAWGIPLGCNNGFGLHIWSYNLKKQRRFISCQFAIQKAWDLIGAIESLSPDKDSYFGPYAEIGHTIMYRDSEGRVTTTRKFGYTRWSEDYTFYIIVSHWQDNGPCPKGFLVLEGGDVAEAVNGSSWETFGKTFCQSDGVTCWETPRIGTSN